MLDHLRRKARRLEVKTLETHAADAYHLPMPDESVDLAFMASVLAEITDRQRALEQGSAGLTGDS